MNDEPEKGFIQHLFCDFCIQTEEDGGPRVVDSPRSPGFVSCLFVLFFPSWLYGLDLLSLKGWGCSARHGHASWGHFWQGQESLCNHDWTVEIGGYCVNKTLHLFEFYYVRIMYKSVIFYHNIKLGMFSLWLGIKLILKSFWRMGSGEHVQQRLSRLWDQGHHFLDYQKHKRPRGHPIASLNISDQREVLKQ